MRLNGATEQEIQFLLTRRVELNALTSRQLVDMIEEKLTAHDVKKVIPDDDVLAETYRKMAISKKLEDIIEKTILEDIIEKTIKDTAEDKIEIPADLREQIDKHSQKHQHMRWDEAMDDIVLEPGP
jgi:uncharacterized membrane protein YheB (UPF0754 family)